MLKKIYFFFLFLIAVWVPLRAEFFITCKDGGELRLAFPQDSLEEGKDVFFKAFTAAYQNNEMILNDIRTLKKMDLTTFLNVSFEDDEIDFFQKKKDVLFIIAKTENNQAVGYISFDKGENLKANVVYVRALAVDPAFAHKGLGTALVYSILNFWGKTEKLQLVTRKANSQAVSFYQKLGFTFSEFVHSGLDPEIYCGLEKFLSEDEIKEKLAIYHYIDGTAFQQMTSNFYKILSLPITSPELKNIEITECNDVFVDLNQINNPRIVSLANFDEVYTAGHNEYGKVRKGLYDKLISLLQYLPSNAGVAFFEAYRPLWKQQEYFDKVFKELVEQFDGDGEKAYQETSKRVSPFIDNIPVHCTGAAIDLTLFVFDENGTKKLLDLGKFGVIFGKNNQAETLTGNITEEQRQNRQMLLEAASKAGLVNYGYEWWHYSYGDRAWAYVEKREKAIYGLTANNELSSPVSIEDYFKVFQKK